MHVNTLTFACPRQNASFNASASPTEMELPGGGVFSRAPVNADRRSANTASSAAERAAVAPFFSRLPEGSDACLLATPPFDPCGAVDGAINNDDGVTGDVETNEEGTEGDDVVPIAALPPTPPAPPSAPPTTPAAVAAVAAAGIDGPFDASNFALVAVVEGVVVVVAAVPVLPCPERADTTSADLCAYAPSYAVCMCPMSIQ